MVFYTNTKRGVEFVGQLESTSLKLLWDKFRTAREMKLQIKEGNDPLSIFDWRSRYPKLFQGSCSMLLLFCCMTDSDSNMSSYPPTPFSYYNTGLFYYNSHSHSKGRTHNLRSLRGRLAEFKISVSCLKYRSEIEVRSKLRLISD